MGKKICGIYCIENLVNGKKYIGQSVDIYKRWSRHRSELNDNRHKNVHLQNSWNKYKESNFHFYILERCNVDELDEKETYFINQFNTTNGKFGYNKETGGHTLKSLSDETKKKIGDAHRDKPLSEEHKRKIGEKSKGHVVTPEAREKISQKLKGLKRTEEYCSRKSKSMQGNKNFNFGVPRNEETKLKISVSNSKSVYCRELGKVFGNGKIAEEITGVNKSNISSCCHKRRKYAGRHPVTGEPLTWIFCNEYFDIDLT